MASFWQTTGNCLSRSSILPPYRSQLLAFGRLNFKARQYASKPQADKRNEMAIKQFHIPSTPASSFHTRKSVPNGSPRPGGPNESVESQLDGLEHLEELLRRPAGHVIKGARTDVTVAEKIVSDQPKQVASYFIYSFCASIVFFGAAAFLARADTKSLMLATPGDKPSIEDFKATRVRRELGAAQRSLNKYRRYINQNLLQYYASWRKSWIAGSDAKKAAYLLGGINISVFIAWQAVFRLSRLPMSTPAFVAQWPHFMLKYFTERSSLRLARGQLERTITPVTHMFSHNRIMHLLGCMFGLTFAVPAGLYLSSRSVQDGLRYNPRDPQELAGMYQLIAFFVTAGVFASLGGRIHTALLARKALRSIPPNYEAFTRQYLTSSLGASGAVYAVLAVATIANPDMRVGIFFVSFPQSTYSFFPSTISTSWLAAAFRLTEHQHVIEYDCAQDSSSSVPLPCGEWS